MQEVMPRRLAKGMHYKYAKPLETQVCFQQKVSEVLNHLEDLQSLTVQGK